MLPNSVQVTYVEEVECTSHFQSLGQMIFGAQVEVVYMVVQGFPLPQEEQEETALS